MASRRHRHIVVAYVGYLTQISWLAKFEATFRGDSRLFELWGWERGPRPPGAGDDYQRRILHRSTRRGRVRLALHYLVWMVKVFLAVLCGPRDVIYWTVSFDGAFPTALATLLRPALFVFADCDSISKSYAWPQPVKRILEKLEVFAARRSALHILPGPSRQIVPLPQDRFLPNSPVRAAIDRAKAIAAREGIARGEQFTLYVNGWLQPQRGLATLIEMLHRCPPQLVRVTVAGKVDNEQLKVLSAFPNVQNFGRLPPDDALALYYGAHLVYTYYDPSIEINRVAEPNKWHDCIATATPFAVNSEVQTAKPFIEAGVCVHAPYDDAAALAHTVETFACDRTRWREVQSKLEKMQTPAWDEMLGKLVVEVEHVAATTRRFVRKGANPGATARKSS